MFNDPTVKMGITYAAGAAIQTTTYSLYNALTGLPAQFCSYPRTSLSDLLISSAAIGFLAGVLQEYSGRWLAAKNITATTASQRMEANFPMVARIYQQVEISIAEFFRYFRAMITTDGVLDKTSRSIFSKETGHRIFHGAIAGLLIGITAQIAYLLKPYSSDTNLAGTWHETLLFTRLGATQAGITAAFVAGYALANPPRATAEEHPHTE